MPPPFRSDKKVAGLAETQFPFFIGTASPAVRGPCDGSGQGNTGESGYATSPPGDTSPREDKREPSPARKSPH